MVIALADTETGLNHYVKHKGDVAQGICGVVPEYHSETLKRLNVDLNSLKACEVVYLDYLKKNNGNKVKALADYKGIKSKKNIYLVYKVLDKEKQIKDLKWKE